MSSDAVQQIKDRLSILDVIGPYVELHKAGKSFKGKSPFTNERTPSFYVSPEKGMYYCFSTSQGGDMFTFLQQIEGVEFKEALRILAEKAGVELTPERPEAKSERDRLYAALEAATTYFTEQLAKQPEALQYLDARGVREETRQAWRIGYAPGPPRGGWRELKQALEAEGFRTSELLKAGLIKQTDGGKEPFDVFRDRVVFPLRESAGKVVGFSGRILEKGSEAPKYVNSPDTELYHKSSLLFGYDLAKAGIRQYDFTLIVEGQFDVVMCHQAGYHNAVAVSGTALTEAHVRQLERLSRRVVLALDADRAGVAAVKRATELMLARGFDVKVASLPSGQDPADLALADPKALKRVIGESVHVVEFLLRILETSARDERTFKLRVREEVLPFVLALQNRIDQEHFEGVIAGAIGTSRDAVHFEVTRLRDEVARSDARTAREAATPAEPVAVSPRPDREAELTAYLLAAADELDDVPGLAPALVVVLESSLEVLREQVPATARSAASFSLEEQAAAQPRRSLHEEIAHRLTLLRQARLRRLMRTERERLAEAERLDDAPAAAAALAMISELQQQLSVPPYTREHLTSPEKSS